MIDISPDLESFLREEYGRCFDTALDDERATAIKRYNGQPYGDEEEGRSQVVARDTATTADYMIQSIMRTLVSGDRVFEFVHKDADVAHEITETIAHIFMEEQDGFQSLHDWLKAGLLEKTAVAMTYMEEQSPKRRKLNGVSEMALISMMMDGANIVEAEETGEGEDGPVYTAVVKEERGPKFCDAAVPNEEFYCSTDAATIDAALLKGRRIRKHISELVAEGFDRDELEEAGDSDGMDDALRTARDDGRYNDNQARRDGVARQVWWHEEWAKFDANGDGIAELLYIRRTGDYKVFAIDEMEEDTDHPFEDWCPFPMHHRRVGQSLADKVMDLERISTVLLRQSLDGIYLANSPSTYLHEASIGTNTVEDLLNVRPGRIVRWKGQVEPKERTGSFNAADGFNMLEYNAGQLEQRTGITRLNQGLDAETLNKTATGAALISAQGQQMEEYIARNFGNALARLVTKKARLMKAYGKPIEVPIDGKYRTINPAEWPDDVLARPRIGLGASRKEQKLAFRREMMGMQQALVQGGFTGLVDEKNLFNAAKGFVADTGLGEVTEFFNDPAPIDSQSGQPVPKPPQPPKPDPAMAKVQADAQAQQAEMQLKAQSGAAEMQLKREEAALRLKTMQEEAAAKLELERQKAAAQIQLARDKAIAEGQLAREQMAAEAALEQQRMAMQRDSESERMEHDAELSKNRDGGDLDK